MNLMKNSEIEWIGNIPKTWDIIKFKNIIKDSISGEVIDKTYWNEGEELLYTCQKTPMKSTFKNFPKNKKTTNKDLLLTRNATPYVFISIEGAIYSNVVQKVTIKDNWDKRYIKYAIQLGANEQQVNGDTIPSYNMNIWENIYICKIPLIKQETIANFLDQKCSEIDSLYSDIEKQIKVLEEYKKAIITEAVTKGLNSDVKMKYSGIEWIGFIPEHWSCSKLKYLGKCQNGISKGGEFFGEGFPFVSYGDVYKNYSLPLNVEGLIRSTQNEQNNYSVKYGDVFFTRTSETIEEIGFSSTCLNTIKDAVFAGFLIRFRPHNLNKIHPNFSKYYFRSEIHRKYFVKEMNLVTRASLSQILLGNLPVLLPPLNEQITISNYLDNKCTEIDKVIADKKAQLETLVDYKKSLIYEYVTGKKEVPNDE